MPLHVFIAQSASLVTGGIGAWKAAKDILVVLLVPALLLLAAKKHLFKKEYKWHFILGATYVLLHLLFVVFDSRDDTYSAIVGSVYNTRLLIYLLLGLVVGSLARADEYRKKLLTAAVLIAGVVAMFGVAQYFLPKDILTHVGYSLERGVKPMFFIDDKPDLPRVMSTLKDPNSLGAYLILPLVVTGLALLKKGYNERLFSRPFRQGTLIALFGIMTVALLMTFSRGALLGTGIATAVAILSIVTGQRVFGFIKKYKIILLALSVFIAIFVSQIWHTYTFQNVVFHADQSTVLEDPNELRVTLTQEAVSEIVDKPQGYGPGTAGLVSINNPKGGQLTENYYLQIAHEVGWLGFALFSSIFVLVLIRLMKHVRSHPIAAALFASGLAYGFYSLLIHLWSNEAVALQWWLLAGIALVSLQKETELSAPKTKRAKKVS
jgi:hypothetical protein